MQEVCTVPPPGQELLQLPCPGPTKVPLVHAPTHSVLCRILNLQRARGVADGAVEGFPREVRSACRAQRAPIENFAGRLIGEDGVRTSILELTVDAVGVTQDYSVFSSQAILVLLHFKWSGYARVTFLRKVTPLGPSHSPRFTLTTCSAFCSPISVRSTALHSYEPRCSFSSTWRGYT